MKWNQLNWLINKPILLKFTKIILNLKKLKFVSLLKKIIKYSDELSNIS